MGSWRSRNKYSGNYKIVGIDKIVMPAQRAIGYLLSSGLEVVLKWGAGEGNVRAAKSGKEKKSRAM